MFFDSSFPFIYSLAYLKIGLYVVDGEIKKKILGGNCHFTHGCVNRENACLNRLECGELDMFSSIPKAGVRCR